MKTGRMYYVSIFLGLFFCLVPLSANDHPVLTMLFYPTGTLSESYRVDLNEKGEMQVIMGERSQEEEGAFDWINSKEYIVIGQRSLDEIIMIRDEILMAEDVNISRHWTDSWMIILLLDQKRYEFYRKDYINKPLGKMVEEILRISPISIDLHAW